MLCIFTHEICNLIRTLTYFWTGKRKQRHWELYFLSVTIKGTPFHNQIFIILFQRNKCFIKFWPVFYFTFILKTYLLVFDTSLQDKNIHLNVTYLSILQTEGYNPLFKGEKIRVEWPLTLRYAMQPFSFSELFIWNQKKK